MAAHLILLMTLMSQMSQQLIPNGILQIVSEIMSMCAQYHTYNYALSTQFFDHKLEVKVLTHGRCLVSLRLRQMDCGVK